MSSWQRFAWSAGRVAQRSARWWVRASWFGVIPALLAALALRHGLPSPWQVQNTWAEPVARAIEAHALVAWAVLMVLFASLLRYWAARLAEARLLPAVLGEKARAGRTSGMLVSRIALAAAVSIGALLFRASVGSTYEVLGGSMLPTLEPGDLVAGSRLAYGVRLPGDHARAWARSPRRGEVVVVPNPEPGQGSGEPMVIKRVIGLPGDRMQMRGNVPVINGFPVPGCDAGYYLHASHHLGAQGRVFVEFLDDSVYLALYAPIAAPFVDGYVVPPGELFLLGDNRGNSADSRAWNEGKGASIAEPRVEARVSWFLAARRLDDRLDVQLLGRGIELQPHFAELDSSALREGIAACLRQRPTVTSPPSSDASATSVASTRRAEP